MALVCYVSVALIRKIAKKNENINFWLRSLARASWSCITLLSHLNRTFLTPKIYNWGLCIVLNQSSALMFHIWQLLGNFSVQRKLSMTARSYVLQSGWRILSLTCHITWIKRISCKLFEAMQITCTDWSTER